MKNKVIKNLSLQKLEKKIISMRNENGIWEGELSSSALSTAVASFALWKLDSNKYRRISLNGIEWLRKNINTDGGWGDTIKSQSNMSTTLLCWAALSIVKDQERYFETNRSAEDWLFKRLGGNLDPGSISSAILKHYKNDRTFSVPILAMCALAGRLGKDGWKMVPQLPFQFAALPDRFFKFLNLSVVSYAVPALIAIGLVKFGKSPPKNKIIKWFFKISIPKVLRILEQKQADNGGFLEAAPLTAFVLMSLYGGGYSDINASKKASNFLYRNVRPDGSWPIDTSLTTWVTTLAINNLSNESFLELEGKDKIFYWLLSQQHKSIHPFTKSNPGGWAWINTPGGVPDGDDTSGVLLALKRFHDAGHSCKNEVIDGIKWLISIQNKDGGFPTFCKGWGKLPFDASCPDISAHAIRALIAWKDEFDPTFNSSIKNSISGAIRYLRDTQEENGSWLPLWFGNEMESNHENPVYGTSLVVVGLIKARNSGFSDLENIIYSGKDFLIRAKNNEGLWGANKGVRASVEETSLAVQALIDSEEFTHTQDAINWLNNIIRKYADHLPSQPIGLYFASLWYYEKMYPYVYSCAALNKANNIDINETKEPLPQ